MSLKKQIKKDNPDASSEVLWIADQIEDNADIKALSDTEGGKKLAKMLIQDVVGSVRALQGGYKEFTLEQFQSTCATLNAHLNLAQMIIASKDNETQLYKMLEEALAE